MLLILKNLTDKFDQISEVKFLITKNNFYNNWTEIIN